VFERASRRRDVILELVRSTMDHPTADWVYRQARRRLPRLSLATVYRNLKQLAQQGLIREIQAAGHASRFDGNTGRHYHVRCLGCGRVNDLPLSVDPGLERAARRAINFEILGHQVEFQGLCPLCRPRATSEKRSHSKHDPKEAR
jgi:Fur family ferric uptake transcriptional regulator